MRVEIRRERLASFAADLLAQIGVVVAGHRDGAITLAYPVSFTFLPPGVVGFTILLGSLSISKGLEAEWTAYLTRWFLGRRTDTEAAVDEGVIVSMLALDNDLVQGSAHTLQNRVRSPSFAPASLCQRHVDEPDRLWRETGKSIDRR